jgi:hypothetical protein
VTSYLYGRLGALLAPREAVGSDHADQLAVLRYQLLS